LKLQKFIKFIDFLKKYLIIIGILKFLNLVLQFIFTNLFKNTENSSSLAPLIIIFLFELRKKYYMENIIFIEFTKFNIEILYRNLPFIYLTCYLLVLLVFRNFDFKILFYYTAMYFSYNEKIRWIYNENYNFIQKITINFDIKISDIFRSFIMKYENLLLSNASFIHYTYFFLIFYLVKVKFHKQKVKCNLFL